MFSCPQDIVARHRRKDSLVFTCLQSYWAGSHNTKYVSELTVKKTNCGGLPEEEKLTVKGKGGIRTHARAFARLSP